MSFSLRERFLLKKPSVANLKDPLWIHCASVGEFNTLKPLIAKLRERYPVVLTYFSPRAESYLKSSAGFYDLLFPLPADLPPLIRRFEGIIRPRALLIMERELWFSLISFTRCRKILLNAYAKGSLMERLLAGKFSLILTRTERDREIFLREGARRVFSCGNLKLVAGEEVRPPANVPPKREKVLVAGSTHEGEEEVVLRVFAKLRERYPLRLVLAPRHMDRVERVRSVVEAFGFEYALRTESGREWEVLILNTLGELRSFYLWGDVAFVGGTLVPVGGHNLLEPALCGRPVLFGPHTHKVRDLEEILLEKELGFRVKGEEEFLRVADTLLREGFTPAEDLAETSRRIEECYLRHLLSELEQIP